MEYSAVHHINGFKFKMCLEIPTLRPVITAIYILIIVLEIPYIVPSFILISFSSG